jgi:hypothetical protein
MSRFIRRGKAKFYFLPTIADPGLVPTTAEITAGIDLSKRIADLAGWRRTGSSVATPDMGSDFVSNIAGEKTVDESSFTFYADDEAATEELKTAMPEDMEGFIYICGSGRAAGKEADTFPVRVNTVGNEYSVGNDPARFMISYAVTDNPAIDQPQPAMPV